MPSIRCLVCVAAVLATGVSRSLAHEEQVIVVGRTAAGALVVDSDFDQPVELPLSIFPGIPGYATGELAFHSTILDDPANDFFQLSTATDFRFILLAKDPDMEVWNDTGSGYMETNETFFIGSSPFDVHPIWNLVNGIPGSPYSLTLKLRDLNGVYPDSDPFVLSFTPVEIRHRLNLVQVDLRHAVLLWTTNTVGWKLQSAASMAATDWDTVSTVPEIDGTNFSLSITTADTQRFFRLSKP